MEPDNVWASLGISVGLGLLVGLQRERAGSQLAGVRTFPLIALLGTLAALIGLKLGAQGWVIAAGFVSVAAASGVGNILMLKGDRVRDAGITTEVAVLVMYGLGAYAVVGPPAVVTAVGVGVAVLLHAKESLHGLVGRIADKDMRAIMLLAAISFVVLPVLPNEQMGPYGLLNPRKIWLMVVLVVGISLAGYVAFKFLGTRGGMFVGGLLGGLISSTATTVTYSRRARDNASNVGPALVVIMLASAVVYVRLMVEISAAGPALLPAAAGPLGVMLALSLVLAGVAWVMARPRGSAMLEPENPTQLKSALIFAGLYALVLVAVAWGKTQFGQAGVYAIAGVSGLTDMDAITLSSAQMVSFEGLAPRVGWQAILIAAISNMVFKAGVAGSMGGVRLIRWLAPLYAVKIVAALLLIMLWP